MLVVIAILAVAFAGPVRKWIRRRRARHSAQGLPPYWAPAAPASTVSSAHPPSRIYSSRPSRTTDGGHRSSGTIAYSEAVVPSSPSLTPPPGQPGIRTLFATHLAAGQNESSERREHDRRGWSKLAFWRKSPVAAGGEKRVLARDAYGRRSV
jgi:hypothetical protein